MLESELGLTSSAAVQIDYWRDKQIVVTKNYALFKLLFDLDEDFDYIYSQLSSTEGVHIEQCGWDRVRHKDLFVRLLFSYSFLFLTAH